MPYSNAMFDVLEQQHFCCSFQHLYAEHFQNDLIFRETLSAVQPVAVAAATHSKATGQSAPAITADLGKNKGENELSCVVF